MKKLLCILIFIVLLHAYSFAEDKAIPEMLTVHFLDIGQGDASIIQCGGQTLLIDGGDKEGNQFLYSYMKGTLNLEYLDYIIATHPHDDHVKGLATALVVCDVGTVYSPVTEYDGEGFLDFQKKLEERNAVITIPNRGDSFTVGSATVIFLSNPQMEWDMNDQSLVVKVVFGETSFLFTGDAAWETEQEMLSSGIDLTATVLKVGHHGSATSSCQEFLNAVNPKYAVISVGQGNKYGHPADKTIMKLQRMNVSVFRTDKHGTIVFNSDGTNMGIVMSKKNRKW